MAVVPTAEQIEGVLRDLLGCLCTSLAAAGWEGNCCLQPGAVAWTQCCADGGTAWVRLIEAYPSEHFPAQGQAVDPSRCEAQWAVRAELGALTCVCFELCDCEVRDANAVKVIALEGAMLDAVACCGLGEDVRVVGLTGVGPEGECAGATLQVVAALSVCCPDDEEAP